MCVCVCVCDRCDRDEHRERYCQREIMRQIEAAGEGDREGAKDTPTPTHTTPTCTCIHIGRVSIVIEKLVSLQCAKSICPLASYKLYEVLHYVGCHRSESGAYYNVQIEYCDVGVR